MKGERKDAQPPFTDFINEMGTELLRCALLPLAQPTIRCDCVAVPDSSIPPAL